MTYQGEEMIGIKEEKGEQMTSTYPVKVRPEHQLCPLPKGHHDPGLTEQIKSLCNQVVKIDEIVVLKGTLLFHVSGYLLHPRWLQFRSVTHLRDVIDHLGGLDTVQNFPLSDYILYKGDTMNNKDDKLGTAQKKTEESVGKLFDLLRVALSWINFNAFVSKKTLYTFFAGFGAGVFLVSFGAYFLLGVVCFIAGFVAARKIDAPKPSSATDIH